MLFRKSYTLTLTISDFDLLFVFVLFAHILVLQRNIDLDSFKNSSMLTKEIKEEKDEKYLDVPLNLRWALSKRTRASRFNKYMKNMKEVDFSGKLIDSEIDMGLDNEALKKIENLNLSQSDIQKIVKANENMYKENVKELREILQKNQKKFQSCYEKSLLKDELLSGVSSLILMVKNGKIIDANTSFKGDGHKSAVKTLETCLSNKSKRIKISNIKGNHKVKFNLVFKS